MANQFASIPAPAGNGSGAAVDVSSLGGTKTITVNGTSYPLQPTVTIEFSNQTVPTNWAPLVTFVRPGERTMLVAARWMRATVQNYRGGGAPTVAVGGDDSGATFATLVSTSGDGSGAPVDTSDLPDFKTIHVAEAFRGVLNVEVSEDGGTTYATIASFYGPGYKSAVAAAEFMRVSRSGVPQNSPGLPVVNVGAVATGGGGGIGGFYALPEQWAQNNVAAGQAGVAMSAQVSTNFDTIKMIRAGSLVGLATRLADNVTAGTVTIAVSKNGVATALSVVSTTVSNQAGGVATSAAGAITYAAGDLIGVQITTSGGFTPTTTSAEAWVQVKDS